MSVNLSLFAGAGWQFFTDNGIPLSGGLLYTYTAGSTTPETTFIDNGGATQNTNPIILDAAGRPPSEIWLSANTSYKFVVKTSTGTLIRTYDDIPGANDVSYILTELANTSNIAQGDALVGFKQANANGILAGAVGKTVHDKLTEFVSVKDFGAVGDGTTDDTVAIQAAINSGQPISIPKGTYIINGVLAGVSNMKFKGDGIGVAILKKTGSGHILDLYGSTIKYNVEIEGLTFDCNLVDAGIYAEYLDNFKFTNCEVLNTPYWGIVVGIQLGSSSDIVNNYITIQNCKFDNNTQTYEHILILNSANVLIDNCYLSTSINGIGIGLYQNATNVTVSNSYFTALKKPVYYSISCNNLKFINCTFKTNSSGVQGANESDNGLFGYTYTSDIIFDTCRFEELGDAYALQLGRTNNAVVTNCVFYNNSGAGMLINDKGIGPTAGVPSVNTVISNSTFQNNNSAGGGSINFPGILFQTSSAALYTTISNCIFYDTLGTPKQLYPIVFSLSSTYTDVTVVNSKLSAYSSAVSVALNTATIGNNVWVIDCQNTSNSIAVGVRRKMSNTGTPEAVVTAGIGSIFNSLDGGAGTTMYIKESGTGNTGWVGK